MDVENLGTGVEIEENDLLIDTITNLQIFKQFFSTLYKVIGDNLLEVFVNTPMQYKEAIDRDILNHCFFFFNFKKLLSSVEVMKAYNYFYYVNRIFPSRFQNDSKRDSS